MADEHWDGLTRGCVEHTWKDTTARVIMEAQIMESAFFLLKRPE